MRKSRLSFFLSVCLLAACASSTGQAAPASNQNAGTSLTITGLSGAVAQERVLSLDDRGQQLFDSGPLPHQSQQQLNGLPLSTRTLEIQQLDKNGQVVSDFFTQLDLEATPQARVDNPAFVASQDPSSERFVFFGCNRVSPDEATGNPSTANRAQLDADYQEIAHMSPAPSYLFFTGDLVLNEVAGSATLQSQLNAWVSEYQAGPLATSSVLLCAMTGNHEVLVQTGSSDESELPNPATLPVWTQTMAAYLRGDNGPTMATPNPDRLTQDQSKLSYTFQKGNIGFMVLNTDTFTTDNVNSQVPLFWTDQQLDALQSNSQIQHVFVLGHRPINSLDSEENAIQASHGQTLQAQLQAHSKVRAYLCAHAHHWNYQKLGKLPQITAGNGGSKAEKSFRKKGYYGYTVVHLKASGKVHIESWGRSIPDPYASTSTQPAATLREKFSL